MEERLILLSVENELRRILGVCGFEGQALTALMLLSTVFFQT